MKKFTIVLMMALLLMLTGSLAYAQTSSYADAVSNSRIIIFETLDPSFQAGVATSGQTTTAGTITQNGGSASAGAVSSVQSGYFQTQGSSVITQSGYAVQSGTLSSQTTTK